MKRKIKGLAILGLAVGTKILVDQISKNRFRVTPSGKKIRAVNVNSIEINKN